MYRFLYFSITDGVLEYETLVTCAFLHIYSKTTWTKAYMHYDAPSCASRAPTASLL